MINLFIIFHRINRLYNRLILLIINITNYALIEIQVCVCPGRAKKADKEKKRLTPFFKRVWPINFLFICLLIVWFRLIEFHSRLSTINLNVRCFQINDVFFSLELNQPFPRSRIFWYSSTDERCHRFLYIKKIQGKFFFQK